MSTTTSPCFSPGPAFRTLSAFWHDLLHGVFHFEGKIWRTLPMLAWRPGVLTRSYIEGKRATYVSPIALFLFSAFLLSRRAAWDLPFTLVTLVCGTIPLVSFWAERRATRRVRAEHPELA